MSLVGWYYEKNKEASKKHTCVSYGNQFKKDFFGPKREGF